MINDDNVVSLKKAKQGEIISLSKGVTKAFIKLKWFNKDDNKEVDADLSAFCIGADGKILDGVMKNLLYFGTQTLNDKDQMILHDGALTHSGDDLGGSQNTDGASEEEIAVIFSALPKEVKGIRFFSTIYIEDGDTYVDFSDVSDCSVLVSNAANKPFISYDIAKSFPRADSIMICGFDKVINKWEFTAIGIASSDDLEAILKKNSKHIIIKND